MKPIRPMVLTLALFAGGLAMFVAGIWEFRNRRNSVAALRKPPAITVTLWLLVAVLVVLTLANYNKSASLLHLGGHLGLADAALAWYVAGASVISDTFRKAVLPCMGTPTSTIVPSP
ncbi:MAG: hypothetical protein ACYDH5_08985 [Acidimicrobiales bacterium]